MRDVTVTIRVNMNNDREAVDLVARFVGECQERNVGMVDSVHLDMVSRVPEDKRV